MNDITLPNVLTAVPVDHRLSKAEYVYRVLRHEIVTLALEPGAVIDKAQVCKRLDVSRFPVSDALSRLDREGLVLVEPQRGSFVALIDAVDIRASLFLRKAIEADATRHAAENVTDAVKAELETRLAKQAQFAAANEAEAFHEEDFAFHQAIVGLLKLPRVAEANAVACAHLERVRRLTMPGQVRFADVVEEHRAVVQAIVAGDGEKAAAAMRAHLEKMQANVDRLAASRPELFTA